MSNTILINCRVTKLSSIATPKFKGKPFIKDGYTLKGFTTKVPTVGSQLIVHRYERNGIKIDGIFTSTKVTFVKPRINGFYFRTENSRYQFSFLK